MGWASEQLLRDLAKAGIYPMGKEPELPRNCEGCPFIVQDEDTGYMVCGLGGKMGECDERY